jgi:hypothetical protein
MRFLEIIEDVFDTIKEVEEWVFVGWKTYKKASDEYFAKYSLG